MKSLSVAVATFLLCGICSAAGEQYLPVRISWGHKAARTMGYFVSVAGAEGAAVEGVSGAGIEAGDAVEARAARTRAGAGDVDGLRFTVAYPGETPRHLQDLHIIWADLIAAADPDTARRLGSDAAMEPHAPRILVRTSEDGLNGFAVTVPQLLRERAIWVPSIDLYITAGEPFREFAEHEKTIGQFEGRRILERVRKEPEATYEQYVSAWEDMGNPRYTNPEQRGPGHIVGLSWDGSIHKFGIDRGGGVWNDYGNPDRFRFWFDFADLTHGILDSWQSQRLQDGLPVVTTVVEKDGVRYEVEQFAYPLHGPPATRDGRVPMVLMQKLSLSTLDGQTRRIPITLNHSRSFQGLAASRFEVLHANGVVSLREASFGGTVLEIDGFDGTPLWAGVDDYDNNRMKRANITLLVDIPAEGKREIVVKLPSPAVDSREAETLKALNYAAAKDRTVRYWTAWLEKGAVFRVPEKAVNDLYAAALWHALRLPRRHGGGPDSRIDLPYSNFAYSQTGTPWPVNQSVYVDYMVFGLRGYFDVAMQELAAQYRNNQELDGHVAGYANWLVYTPGMLYSVAQNFLLSGNREEFDKLLEPSLRAMDWCLQEVHSAAKGKGSTKGLISGPLNDLTGEGLWAFNQAYLYAGLDRFGRALQRIGHPRAQEALDAADGLSNAINRGFRAASAQSPLVQMRDHTWIPYVPGNAAIPGRMMDTWYPTDVDTGPVHLLRLRAIPSTGDLASWLLNDHEDNLFYKGLGIANEPVYNQQGTAYLLRDDAPAVVRTFYSYMASAFSHGALEPVEHRWTHGQYFGPPSTDGAWMELYRNMLVFEQDDDTLLLGGFAPRRWMEDGKQIEVKNAPTRFGRLAMTLESHVATGSMKARVGLENRVKPAAVLVRFRHPDGKRMEAVTLNGKDWKDFDPGKEWVRIPNPDQDAYSIDVRFSQ